MFVLLVERIGAKGTSIVDIVGVDLPSFLEAVSKVKKKMIDDYGADEVHFDIDTEQLFMYRMIGTESIALGRMVNKPLYILEKDYFDNQ